MHFLRDLRGHCRKDQHDALGALVRQLFTAPDGTEARRRLADAIAQLEPRLAKIARLLDEAEDDVLAFYAFPAEHSPKLRSTNPLERFNREIGRRTNVVGIFPDDPSLIRLVSMLAIEANDCHEGWQRRASGLSSPRRRLGACENTRVDARRQICSISVSIGVPAAPRGAR
jgi:putative transposase